MRMPLILIDARSLADFKCGGISRVAKIWILDQTASFKASDCFCVTTGLKESPTVRDFCTHHNFNYLHIKIPNKIWTVLCHLNLVSIILSAEKKLKKPIDLLLLPNLAYTGALYRPYHILVHDLSFLIEPQWFTWRRKLWHKFVNAKRRIQNADEIHCVSSQTKSDCIRLLNVNDSQCKLYKIIPSITRYAVPARLASKSVAGRPARLASKSVAGRRVTRDDKPDWLPQTALRFILMLGGADPRKNIKTALKAIQEYNFKFPQKYIVPVVIGGPVAFHGEFPVACILAPGYINDTELNWLYKNASALLYPSWYEGFGLPLHEAANFDTPVIASTAGALSETAPPNAILCHPAKVNEWVTALQISLEQN